jgi:hypothetical protein
MLFGEKVVLLTLKEDLAKWVNRLKEVGAVLCRPSLKSQRDFANKRGNGSTLH